MDFATVIAAFALAWSNDGYPVPAGYLSSTAQPPSQSARKYQQRRGPGDGRRLVAVMPAKAIHAAGSGYDFEEFFDIVLASDANDYNVTTLMGVREPDTSMLDDKDATLAMRTLSAHDKRERPTHPLTEPGGTGTEGGQTPATGPTTPPIWNLNEGQTLDVRGASSTAALPIFVSVLVQPLVLAHANGFTSAGLIMPESASRPEAMHAVQALCTTLTTAAAYIAFMVGEYADGMRVFTAPVDYYPPPDAICRTPEQRRRAGLAGAAFVWCTVAALGGSPLGDAAARAVMSCEMSIKPVHTLADSAPSPGAPELSFAGAAS